MAETTQVEEKKAEQNQDQQASGDEQNQADSKTQVHSAEFPEAAEAEGTASGGGINILLNVNIPVTVAIGQTEVPVRRLLQLAPGAVLKLDKPIDAPADLYLKDKKFATGKVVVVDGRFAVRIKQILGLGKPAGRDSEP
jgi:flagellar motor switch protein FliN/FliY